MNFMGIDTANGPGVHCRRGRRGSFSGGSGNSRRPRKSKFLSFTEPSLPRRDAYGLSYQSPLKWHDQAWVEQFIDMIIILSEYLKVPASVIEIHPGDDRNTYEDLIRACREILRRYESALGIMPQILLENRTGQFISTGKDLAAFWRAIIAGPGDLKFHVGIVLDSSSFIPLPGQNFDDQFSLIPLEAIKGLHIHSKHRTPSFQDKIPWRMVFERIRSSKEPRIINPEIHHGKAVPEAVEFCRNLLK